MDVEFRNLTFKVDQGIRGFIPFLSGQGKLFSIFVNLKCTVTSVLRLCLCFHC